MISINSLTVAYGGFTLLNDINFHISESDKIGLVGKNGAGKSTTIKMLTGILYPDTGELEVDGYIPYKQRKQYVKNIGVVFGQKTQLWWDIPVIDSFELLRDIYSVPKEQYARNLEELTALLQLI